MLRYFLLAMFCCIALIFFGCNSASEKKSEKQEGTAYRETEQQADEQQTEEDKYRSPDGGFGTIDGAKDAREEAEQSGKDAEEAMKETQ